MDPEGNSRQLAELLKEYSIKLATLEADLRQFQDKKMTAAALDDVELAQKRVKRMMAPMERLARVVSQRLEHTIVSEALEIELELRLAEFEARLEQVQSLLRIIETGSEHRSAQRIR